MNEIICDRCGHTKLENFPCEHCELEYYMSEEQRADQLRLEQMDREYDEWKDSQL